MNFVDAQRIGIQGHSWGGYQITHLITRTNIFRAVQAGASVTNMISAYGGIRWGSGMSRAFQYERTQSRIGAPPWDAPLQFIENSPIFWVEKVQTPYLTIHNDADEAVPWYQAIEFFNALRRLGKEAYFFNYNTELHGLRNRDNQKHWTVHQDEFFDHYLKGTPKPGWMELGVPYLQRGTRDVSDMFKKKVPTESIHELTSGAALFAGVQNLADGFLRRGQASRRRPAGAASLVPGRSQNRPEAMKPATRAASASARSTSADTPMRPR